MSETKVKKAARIHLSYMMFGRGLQRCAALVGVWFALSASMSFAQATVTVFAAASMKEALDQHARLFEMTSGAKLRVSYAGSNALAKQIEAGAPAAIFISADEAWMNYVAERKLIVNASRRNLVGNTLALIAPANTDYTVDFSSPNRARSDFAKVFSGLRATGRIAMADTNSVPAGKYAQAAFTSLALWDSISMRVARADNVRAALAFVARGEAPLGVVYHSDAVAESKVRIVATFPASSHPAIVYPAALVARNESATARQFLDYLSSEAAQAVWRTHGFSKASR